jgi:perosamine synthetase
MISWWRTEFGAKELQNITDSINDENISQGLVTENFENQLADALNVPYVVATTSGSMALLMALMAADVSRGDEVIVPNRTWIATAHAPLMLGAKVVLTDVKEHVPIIDVKAIVEKITPSTKAIMPVHLGGRAVDMDVINKIALEYELFVIEDACQAFLSRDKKGNYLGTCSDIGCFSLSVAKLISTGQGGFIVTSNQSIYEKLKSIRTHGVSDVINVCYTEMGFNFRFNDILASMGIAQLEIAQKRVTKVNAIYEKYKAGLVELPFLELIPVDISNGETPLYVEVNCNNREKLINYLSLQSIQTRPFYPNLNKARYLAASGKYPNAERFEKHGLVLPCGPEQPLENIDTVLKVLKKFH